jgi:hypothetical protein
MPATTYRVNGNNGSGYATTQDGSAGNELQGAFGWQRALDLAVAGDTISLYGTINLNKLISVTSTNDHSAGPWSAGDAVQDNSTGNIWKGVLVEMAAKVNRIELLAGYTYANVATANGINNTTRTATDTLTAKAYAPGLDDTNSGTISSYITIQGVNSSYVYDGSSFVIDGNAGAIPIYITKNYKNYKNIVCQNSSTRGFYISASTGCAFYRCKALSNTTHGFDIASGSVHIDFIECLASNNTQTGFNDLQVSNNMYIRCQSITNGYNGISGSSFLILNCLVANNTRDGIITNNSNTLCYLIGNVIYNSSGATYSGINIATATTNSVMILHNIIESCNAYPITASAANSQIIEDYNYYYGNGNSNVNNNVTAGANSVIGTASAMVNAAGGDYRAKQTIKQFKIPLDWQNATPLVNMFSAYGIPREILHHANRGKGE